MLLHLDNPKCGAKYNHGMNCNINQLICVFIKILFIIWHAWSSDFNMSNALANIMCYLIGPLNVLYQYTTGNPYVMRNVIGQHS